MKKDLLKLSVLSIVLTAGLTACSSKPTQKDPPFTGVVNREDVNVQEIALAPENALAMIGADQAWKKTSGKNPDGSRVIVAVVGTGVDYNIPDLKEALYINTGEIGTRSGNQIDDDGNGLPDDLFGYDFFSGDPMPFDWHGHDTFTASLIASTGRSNAAVRGVSPNASLLIARYIGPMGTASGFDAAAALEYAQAVQGVKVIYLNWPQGGFREERGLDPNPLVVDAIKAAGAKNIVVVIPAGNTANESIPSFIAEVAKLEHVLVVAGTTKDGRIAKRSNSGKKYVSVAAPQEGATGYYPGSVVSSDLNTTSVAAAMTAGAAALYATLPGYGTAARVKQALLSDVSSGRNGEPLEVLSEGVLSVSSISK